MTRPTALNPQYTIDIPMEENGHIDTDTRSNIAAFIRATQSPHKNVHAHAIEELLKSGYVPVNAEGPYKFSRASGRNTRMSMRVPLVQFTMTDEQRSVVRRNKDLSATLNWMHGLIPQTPDYMDLFTDYRHKVFGQLLESIHAFKYLDSILKFDGLNIYHLDVRSADGKLSACNIFGMAAGAVYGFAHFYAPEVLPTFTGRFSILASMLALQQSGVGDDFYMGHIDINNTRLAWKRNYQPAFVHYNGEWTHFTQSNFLAQKKPAENAPALNL